MPTLKSFVDQIVTIEHIDFLITYFAVGALFAAIVFAVSVVSVPMMLDRGTDTIVAALTSVRALFTNFLPLLVWALLIVIVVSAGFATFFVGLVVAVPIIGHATWHAYKSLCCRCTRGIALLVYATAARSHVHSERKRTVSRLRSGAAARSADLQLHNTHPALPAAREGIALLPTLLAWRGGKGNPGTARAAPGGVPPLHFGGARGRPGASRPMLAVPRRAATLRSP